MGAAFLFTQNKRMGMTKVMVSLMPMGPGQEEKHIPLAVPVAVDPNGDFMAQRKAAFEVASWVFEYTNTSAAWQNRSLSVGDIVQVAIAERQALMVGCCSCGWCLLSPMLVAGGRALGIFKRDAKVRGAFFDGAQEAERTEFEILAPSMMRN